MEETGKKEVNNLTVMMNVETAGRVYFWLIWCWLTGVDLEKGFVAVVVVVVLTDDDHVSLALTWRKGLLLSSSSYRRTTTTSTTTNPFSRSTPVSQHQINQKYTRPAVFSFIVRTTSSY